MSSSASPTDTQRVPLRSIERTMTMSDDHWFMIAHVMLVHGQTDDLVRYAPAALRQTFNRHPRMRLTLLPNEFAMATLHPPIATVDEILDRGLCHIKEVASDDMTLEASRAFVQQVAHTPYDRYTQFPFVFHLWVDKANDRARLFVFSDHYTSDGSSGSIVLNDVLTFAAALSRGESPVPQEMALRESTYDAYLNDHTILGPVLRAVGTLAGRTMFSLMPPPTHILPPNKRQENFRLDPPPNPATMLFADGTPANLVKILAKCRAERTTFTGALSAAVFLSYILQTNGLANKAFKLKWIMAANMRQRVGTAYPSDAVGSYSHVSDVVMPPLDVPSQTFWDLARTIKQCAVAALANTPAMALSFILSDQFIHREGDPALLANIPITAGTFNDLDISSLGKYEHPKRHVFGTGELSIDALHYVGRLPLLTSLCQVYATSVDHVGYAMSHHYDEGTGAKLFENTVAIMEACWSIESETKLADVATALVH